MKDITGQRKKISTRNKRVNVFKLNKKDNQLENPKQYVQNRTTSYSLQMLLVLFAFGIYSIAIYQLGISIGNGELKLVDLLNNNMLKDLFANVIEFTLEKVLEFIYITIKQVFKRLFT